MLSADRLYWRVTYKPAGFKPRRFLLATLSYETHAGAEFVVGIDALAEHPLYLYAPAVTEIVAL